MIKYSRRQAVKKQTQAKVKAGRKRRDDLVFFNQVIKPLSDEADRHMKEADRLFKEAMREREAEKTPGFSVTPVFAMRLLHDALESEQGFKTAFHTPPEDWKPPITTTTRYDLVHEEFGDQIRKALTYDTDKYLATLKAYYELIGHNIDRGLCRECAKFDWRHHLTAYFEGVPIDWVNFNPEERTLDQEQSVTSPLGGTYELQRSGTSFQLPGLAHAVHHEQTCTFCSLLVSALKVFATNEQFDLIARDAKPVELTFYDPYNANRNDHWVLHARFCSDEQAQVGNWAVVVLRFVLRKAASSNMSDAFIEKAVREVGRIELLPNGIDTDLLRLWWHNCKQDHSKCKDPARSPRFKPPKLNALLRVVDTDTDKAVLAPKNCSYVALSYVWGKVAAYKCRKCNKRRDVLTEDEIIPFKRRSLPKTVRDAIRVTELLGERYLWVDTLCIVQDDQAETLKTIAVMDTIYKDAILTIVAADGTDSNAGLVGLDPGSRFIQSVVGSVDSIHLTLQEPAPELPHTIWSSRAWTYQEEQFSRRLLIFAHEKVYYKCNEGSFGEARPFQPLKNAILDTDLDSKLANIHDDNDQVLYAYTKHVQEYTRRQLTVEMDVIHAFEGLMSHISSKSKHNYMFFWGLPQVDIVFAPAWYACQPLRRREVQTPFWNGTALILRDHKLEKRETSVALSSWSWAGWVGPVSYDIFNYPKLGCWTDDPSEGCFFGTSVDVAWAVQDEAGQQAILDVWQKGILTFSAKVAKLEFENVKEYEMHCADDDSCEECRDGTQVRTRNLRMDDGSTWEEGVKEGFLLLEAYGFIDDFASHTVFLFRRDAATGICYREGIIDLQRRKWEAAKPKTEKLRVG